jgi:hypothetical protein
MDVALVAVIYGAGLVTGIVTFAVGMWQATNLDDAPLSPEEQRMIASLDTTDHIAITMRFS